MLLTTAGSQSVAFCLHVQLTETTLSIFHWALFDLDLLGWSALFKKIISLRFSVIIIYVQCEPQRDLNLVIFLETMANFSWNISKFHLQLSAVNTSMEIPFLLVCHHLFTFFDGTGIIRSPWQGLGGEAISGIWCLLKGSFSEEGSSKYPWWYPVSSDIKERTVVLFCWAKHSKYFKSFQV